MNRKIRSFIDDEIVDDDKLPGNQHFVLDPVKYINLSRKDKQTPSDKCKYYSTNYKILFSLIDNWNSLSSKYVICWNIQGIETTLYA